MVDKTTKKKVIPVDTELVCPLAMMSSIVDNASGMPVLKHCVTNCQFYLNTEEFTGCAMVLSFTENFERSDFSPIEEARFFAKALDLDLTKFGQVPSRNSKEVITLANDLSASAFTISKRLYLLTLPEKVLDSVEIKQEGER